MSAQWGKKIISHNLLALSVSLHSRPIDGTPKCKPVLDITSSAQDSSIYSGLSWPSGPKFPGRASLLWRGEVK